MVISQHLHPPDNVSQLTFRCCDALELIIDTSLELEVDPGFVDVQICPGRLAKLGLNDNPRGRRFDEGIDAFVYDFRET